METFLQLAGILLGAGTVATLLASGWYVVTQKEPLDRGTILTLAKIFYGIAVPGLLVALLLKYL
jgi:hypothetical protein